MEQMPVQNTPQKTLPQQPVAPVVPPTPAQIPQQPASPLPKPPWQFPKLSPPLLLALLAVVIVSLGIFLTVNSKIFQKIKPTPTPSPIEDHSKPPEENLVTANGRIVSIVSINKDEAILEITTTTANWDKKWQAKVGQKTVIALANDWFSPKGVSKDKLLTITAEELAQIVPKLKISDYKIGDTIYLIAANGQDLTKELGVFEPFAILLFSDVK